MRLRRLGKTGLDISELTLSTSALGGDPALARATIARALEHGINAVEIGTDDDAAAALILEQAGGQVHALARVPSLIRFDLPSPHVLVHQAYPGDHIRAETERLLRALGIERLALIQLHAWCPEWLHEGDWQETAVRLREEGKIAGFGISLFDHDIEAGFEALASGAIDAVQAMYNVFDPAAADLFEQCRQHDVAVIARAPLYYGALAGGTLAFADSDRRSAYFYEDHARETEARVQAIGQTAALPETALRFALSHPAVSTVATGMRTPEQVDANVAAARHGPLAADALTALARHRWLV